MKINIKQFFNFSFLLELFLFAFTLFLALGIAIKTIIRASAEPAVIGVSQGYSVFSFMIMFVIATVVLILILKYIKNPWVIKVLFYAAILEGLWYFSQSYFTWPAYLFVMGIILVVWYIYRNVFIHNIVIVLAISSIAVIFGLNFSPQSVIIILILLAVYDFWAVYKTKHMVRMFKGMVKAQVHFAIIIPFYFQGLFQKTKDVSPETEFMFLGTGDLALPAIFVVSALQISLKTSLITLLGAVAGFVLLYVLFINQKKRKAMPGLPPIISGCLLGFLISFLI